MIYFDTSVLVPLFFVEPASADAESLLRGASARATSDWTQVEFSSVLAGEVRMRALTVEAASRIDDEFRVKVTDSFLVLLPNRDDFDLARSYVRDHQTGLRAPDALHLAVARNNRAETIYTLDKAMLKAGKRLGLPVSAGVRGSR